MDTLFAVEQAVALILFLGCSRKAWIVKPCDDDNTYPKYHIFCVPNTATATVQDYQGKVEGKKDVGDGTERAKRIFEMRCFELLTGIPLHNGPGSNGNYTLQCPTCKAYLFKAVKIPPSKTKNNAETTTMFSFHYMCKHEQNGCGSSQINWGNMKVDSLLPLHFDTALIGACIWKNGGNLLSPTLPLTPMTVQLVEVREASGTKIRGS
jgi:hypothetical protein